MKRSRLRSTGAAARMYNITIICGRPEATAAAVVVSYTHRTWVLNNITCTVCNTLIRLILKYTKYTIIFHIILLGVLKKKRKNSRTYT